MKIPFLFFICVLLFSCSTKKMPADILPPEKMELLLWDQLKADAFTKDFLLKDSSVDAGKENRALQEKIFRKHKTDKNTFYKSYSYYLDHGDMLKNIMDSVIAKQGRVRERMRIRDILKLRENEQNKK
ncbi:MAG: DUF4296 domain-containing protein [Ferruginibacter sp.]